MNEKTNRKKEIANIIATRKIRTQEELISALEAKGIIVTQATLSRDIKELGAVKVNGASGIQYYAIPQAAHAFKSHLTAESIEVSGQICIIKVKPGFASPIASIIDGAGVEGVMGTIAGDDTIIIALQENCDQEIISRTFKTMFNIRIGRQNPQYYEVEEGLEPGERVITSGYEAFKDNEVLKLK